MRASALYCTHHVLSPHVWRACWEQLRAVVAAGGHEWIACSPLPLPDGPSRRITLNLPPGQHAYYSQLLACCEAATCDTVYVCEHDVMYPHGYLDHRAAAGRLDYCAAIRLLDERGYAKRPNVDRVFSQLCADRHDLADILRNRIAKLSDGNAGRYEWIEPDELPCQSYLANAPTLDVRHGRNWTGGRHVTAHVQSDPYGGDSRTLIERMRLGRPATERAVYTVCVGPDADQPAPIKCHPGVPAYLLTDLPDKYRADGWETVWIRAPHAEPRRASRLPKFRPDLYVDAETTLYVDARVDVTGDVAQIFEALPPMCDVAMFPHRKRSCLYVEGSQLIESRKLSTPQRQALFDQLLRYERAGVPHNLGLPECGLILRRRTPAAARFGGAWWDQYLDGCERDQISVMSAAWSTGVRLAWLPRDLSRNPWVHVRPRADERAGPPRCPKCGYALPETEPE